MPIRVDHFQIIDTRPLQDRANHMVEDENQWVVCNIHKPYEVYIDFSVTVILFIHSNREPTKTLLFFSTYFQ